MFAKRVCINNKIENLNLIGLRPLGRRGTIMAALAAVTELSVQTRPFPRLDQT